MDMTWERLILLSIKKQENKFKEMVFQVGLIYGQEQGVYWGDWAGAPTAPWLAAQKWRENEKIKKKWRENEDLRKDEEKERDNITLFPPSVSISYIKKLSYFVSKR